jgi:DNA-binding NarL/FixJ family response regulator
MRIPVSIVEDKKETRELYEAILRGSSKFQLSSSHPTAEDALRKLPVGSTKVVLLDIVLPRMSGVELVRELKKKAPEIRILMLTAHMDTEKIFDALRAGADGYLLKRTEPSEVLDAISDMLKDGAPMSRAVARKVLLHFRRTEKPEADAPELTDRQLDILKLLATGLANKEIAEQLNLSNDTIRWHLKEVYAKLKVDSRTQAIVWYYSHNANL